MAYNNIIIEEKGRVGIITLNRPEAMNAINSELMAELTEALKVLDDSDKIGAIIITGNEKSFAAGADIKEMQDMDYIDIYKKDFLIPWDEVASCKKPLIAAVNGYALGGGCELALACDIIFASNTAKFGQPEITIGIMPGAGGTQRLTRAIGKVKAMEMILTGRTMSAEEADSLGLVSRVIDSDKLLEEAIAVAEKIADFSAPIAMMAKEAINKSYEMTLTEGVNFERRLFQSMFTTEDQKEGMKAFVEKRIPQFKNK